MTTRRVLSDRIERWQGKLEAYDKRISKLQDQKAVFNEKLAMWRNEVAMIDTKRRIRDVAANGWFVYVCEFGHDSHYLAERTEVEDQNVTCWDKSCTGHPEFKRRELPTRKEIDAWREQGYLNRNSWKIRGETLRRY